MSGAKGSVSQIISKVAENKDVVSFYLAKPEDKSISDFRCGQFITLRYRRRNGGWTEPHPFTLSSGPEDDFLRVTIKRVDSFTRALQDSVKEGDEVLLAGSYGSFCSLAEDWDKLVLIAGGVGITPFLSLLRHLRAIGATTDIVLLWANRTWEDVFARGELSEVVSYLSLRVVHVLSREREAPAYAGDSGDRVELGHLNAGMLEDHAGDLRDAGIYLCGPPGMQETVLSELDSLGVPRKRVDTETFLYSG